MLIGANESAAGGHFKAFKRGEEDGCECMQILTKSPRVWNSPPITKDDSQKFISAWKSSSVKKVIAHAAYLINLATEDKTLLEKSINALINERERADILNIPNIIFHPGASNSKDAVQRVANAIDEVIEKTPDCKAKITIENTAGAGSVMGSTFEQLKDIYHSVSAKKQIAFCFDTCHAFSSGYDLRTAEGYNATFKEFDKLIGLGKIECFHLNDSMNELSSHKDRHENIGKGKIGITCFKLLVNDSRFEFLPGTLETHPDAVTGFIPQINTLKELRK